MSEFPPRSNGLPSPAGGFYKYPKKIRSLPNIDKEATMQDEFTRLKPSTAMLMDYRPQTATIEEQKLRSLRELASTQSIMRTFDPDSDPLVDRAKRSIRIEDVEKGLHKSSLGKIPPLVSSNYSLLVEPEPVDSNKFKERGMQTDPPLLLKAQFAEFKDYNNWMRQIVDPFFKALRKSILSNKPSDLELFIMTYCNAVRDGEELPETDDPPPEPIVEIEPEVDSEDEIDFEGFIQSNNTSTTCAPRNFDQQEWMENRKLEYNGNI
jgi:hypothetical protein